MAELVLETGERFIINKSCGIVDGVVTVDGEVVKEDHGVPKQIVFTAMVTPDGTVLPALYYNEYVDKNGHTYSIDVGRDEVRWCSGYGDERFINVYDTDDIETIRMVVGRSGYGKPDTDDYGTYQCAMLYQMSDSWVMASALYTDIPYHKEMYDRETRFRIDNPKYSVEDGCKYPRNWEEALKGSHTKLKSLI